MRITALPRIAVVIAAGLAALVVYQFMTRWQTMPVDGYDVRRNRLTGVAQVKNGDTWTDFQDDPYSTAIDAARLPEVRLSNVTWGPDGLLCVRAANRSAQAFQGRVAFRILQRKISDSRLLPDRTLRVTVNIPAYQTVSLLIRTNLPTPDSKRIRSTVDLQPISYSGMDNL